MARFNMKPHCPETAKAINAVDAFIRIKKQLG